MKSSMIRITSLAIAIGLCVPGSVASQTVRNLNFEERSILGGNTPAGWFTGRDAGYDVAIDTSDFRGGHASLRIRYNGGNGFGVASQSIPAALVRGKSVRLSGFIRTADISTGFAGLWMRVDGQAGGNPLGFDNMQNRGPRGTTPWTRYEIVLQVDTAASNLVFGVLHPGTGTAWFDDLEIQVDGEPLKFTAAARGSATAQEVAWVKAHAAPFKTERAGNGFADLDAVLDIVGKAHIVALGEGTHGTAEFFRMKHRLTELLAVRAGFTVFAIEANMPEARRINEYVLTGKGDPKAALRGIYFWTWNTQEVLDMIEWMRAFNTSGKGRIEFWGFDMQNPTVAMDSVRAFVTRADPAYLATLDSQYLDINVTHRESGTGSLGAIRTWHRGATVVLDHLTAQRIVYLSRFDTLTVDWAIQNARIVLQAAEQRLQMNGQRVPSANPRDSSMALNVKWILDHQPANTRIVLWAHNAHVSRQAGAMGGYLDRLYGNDMRVLGFAFHEGNYTAVGPRGLTSYTALPSISGSVEDVFQRTGVPRFVLDLRPALKEKSAAWLAEPRDVRSIGAMAMDSGFSPMSVARIFDALIWFEKTTASMLLPRSP